MFEITNVGEVSKQLDEWLADATKLLENASRGYAIQVFKGMLPISPQFSGDFVSNWRVSVNQPDTTFEGESLPRSVHSLMFSDPFIAGDKPAMDLALSRNVGKLSSFKFGDTIYISNSAKHDQAYAWKIENNEIDFRPRNAGAVVALTVAHHQSNVRDINNAEAQALAKETFV